jgi:TM2 domain-containing membrane protein YozV
MKDKNTAAILAFTLGGIGVHRFYLGQTGMGIVYLLFCWTFIPAFAAFIEFIMLLTMSQEAFNAKYNQGMLPAPAQAALPAQQNIVVHVASPQGSGAVIDVASQLKQLHELKTAGALTEEEFVQQKQKLLSSGN